MSASNPFAGGNPMDIGKQFWDTWSEFAQNQIKHGGGRAGSGNGAGVPGWHEGLELWSRLTGRSPASDAAHAIEQLSQHGRRMMQMSQWLAGRAAEGKPASAGEIAGAWQDVVGGANPMLETLRSLSGEGARGFEQLAQGVEPLLAMLRGERSSMLGMPAFGLGRERQQRIQAIAAAQADSVERSGAYAGLLAKAGEHALELFESKLAERSEPGRQIDSMRGLYDLWIDAAEEAYAEIALSDEFRRVYGAMVNAQMRVRQLLQQELDQQVGQLGLPTRAELDGTHRKVHALQRDLRELRQQLQQLQPREAGAEPGVAGKAPASRPAVRRKPAAAAPAGKPAAARKAASAAAARAKPKSAAKPKSSAKQAKPAGRAKPAARTTSKAPSKRRARGV
jgi:polyhydroxyalkanoate synthase subunit PhaE